MRPSGPASERLVTPRLTVTDELFPPCPVDRLPRRRRNQICIGVMALGALNFFLYTVIYAAIGGDARNGSRRVIADEDGRPRVVYVLRGHHLRSIEGQEACVSRAVWVYSYLHSISLPLTAGAMIISMLVLARPHILATMRGGWISGATFVTAFGTVSILLSCAAAILFTWDFVRQLTGG